MTILSQTPCNKAYTRVIMKSKCFTKRGGENEVRCERRRDGTN